MKTISRFKTAFLALMALAASGYAGDYSTWSSFRAITINTTSMSLSANVTNIPILIRFTAAAHKDMLDSTTQVQANGSDIRVTKADGTTDVPFEIEHLTTGTTGALHIWILADNVAANNAAAALFRVYWGKTGVTTMSNGAAVFSTTNGYQAVFHMNEATGDVTDVAKGYVGTATGTATSTQAISGASRTFTNNTSGAADPTVTTNYITFAPGASDLLSTHTGSITMEAWVRSSITNSSNSSPGTKTIISHKSGSSDVAWLRRGGGGGQVYAAGGDTTNANGPAVPGGEANVWHYVVGVWDGTAWTVYRQRTSDAWGVTSLPGASIVRTVGGGAPVASTAPWFIGGWSDNGTTTGAITRGWRGQLDEVRVSTVARDTNFVELSFETSKLTPTAITIGATEVPPPPVSGAYANWSGHRSIVLNTSPTGANVATDVTNFPVLVRLGTNELSIIGAANNGNSIRFSKADDATALPYQIEHWSATAAAIWVKVDTVKGNNATQTIRMHWGNNAAASESNGAAVFDTANGFVAAWHLGNATGTNPRPNVITGAPSAIVRNVTGAYQPIPGIIGMADSLPGGAGQDTAGLFGVVRGTRPYIDMRGPYTGYNDLTAGVSYSIWLNPNSVPGTNGFARFLQMTSTDSVNNPSPQNSRLAFLRHSGNGGSIAVRNGQEGGGNTPAIAMPAGAWIHLAFSKTGNGNTKVYVNGDSVHNYNNDNSALVNTDRTNAWIGRSWDPANEYLNAKVDNVVLSKVGRPSAWFKLAYQNQKAENSLTDIGQPVYTAPGQPTNVVAVGGDAQATVTWSAPANNGGKPITGYTVAASSNSALTCTTTGALTCTVTGLANGTFYTFVVSAINEVGTGPASAASNSVVPAVPTPVSNSIYAAWSNSRSIVLNTSGTGANIPGPVYNFPVLVRLGSTESAILSGANGGASIRFAKADSLVALPYQIESWSSTAAAIWVKVDTILGNNATQSILMYWGNSGATSASNGPAVFDSTKGFAAVWHLGDATNQTDATGRGNLGTASTAAPVDTAGLIGRAKAFNGTTNWYQIGTDSTALNLNVDNPAGLTITSWVNPTSCDARIAAFSKYVNGATPAGRQYALHTGNTSTNWRFTVGSPAVGTGEFFTDAEETCVTGTWKHVAGTYASAGTATADSAVNVRIYVDGALLGAGSLATTTGVGTGASTYIGRIHNDQRYMNGLLDEITVHSVRRDSNWIKLAFQNQKTANALVNIGSVAPPVTIPGAPGTPVASASTTTTGAINVTWTAPTNTGNATITAYNVSIASGTPNTATCATTGALSCTVSGLTVGNSYTFTVRATNSAGQGPASSASNSVMPVTGILPGSFVIRMDGTNPYSYRIPASTAAVTEELSMTITDIHGKRVWAKTINPSESRVAEITWNGRNTNGIRVSAGMYIVRISAKMDGQTVEAVRKGVNLK